MIDMHAHWKPAEVADALRARTREPRILRNQDGVEVLKSPRMGEVTLADAFDDVDFHLGRAAVDAHPAHSSASGSRRARGLVAAAVRGAGVDVGGNA